MLTRFWARGRHLGFGGNRVRLLPDVSPGALSKHGSAFFVTVATLLDAAP